MTYYCNHCEKQHDGELPENTPCSCGHGVFKPNEIDRREYGGHGAGYSCGSAPEECKDDRVNGEGAMEKEKQAFREWLAYHDDDGFLFNGDEIGIETVIAGWNSYADTITEQDAEIDALKAEIERKAMALKHIIEYWNGDRETAVDAIEEAISIAEQALSNTEVGG